MYKKRRRAAIKRRRVFLVITMFFLCTVGVSAFSKHNPPKRLQDIQKLGYACVGYNVKYGDTLYQIAASRVIKEDGIDLRDYILAVLEANNRDSAEIRAGERIVILQKMDYTYNQNNEGE